MRMMAARVNRGAKARAVEKLPVLEVRKSMVRGIAHLVREAGMTVTVRDTDRVTRARGSKVVAKAIVRLHLILLPAARPATAATDEVVTPVELVSATQSQTPVWERASKERLAGGRLCRAMPSLLFAPQGPEQISPGQRPCGRLALGSFVVAPAGAGKPVLLRSARGQQLERIGQHVAEGRHEPGGVGSVDHAVVVRQRQRQHHPLDDFALVQLQFHL